MEKHELDEKVEEIAKTLLSYCTARTSNHFEAEDLAQDIILEIYKSAGNIRNADAVYGFMWAVAGNMYKQWCKKKTRVPDCELTENLPDTAELSEEQDSVLYLLRRELTLLSEKHRKAVVLYYLENKSCFEISNHLGVSESMVKYLLFKSRKILKEGMNMERNYGQQSYYPKELSLLFWGNGTNRYAHLCSSKISQNILFACYNDKLSAEQISLEIGVALPYMEDKLAELCEYGLLKKEGTRYCTNIIIFTRDFANEVYAKTAVQRERIADLLISSIDSKEKSVREVGFNGADMSRNVYTWQMASFILYHAVIELLQEKCKLTWPKDKFGKDCYIWGTEKANFQAGASAFEFGISNVRNREGDYVRFMDYPVNGEMIHPYFNMQQNVENIFLDAARGNTEHFSENDKAIAAEMICKGYIISTADGIHVNVPVFTTEQYETIKAIFAETAAEIADEAESLMETVTEILKNHVPVYLKKLTKDMAYFRLHEDAISAPISILYNRKYLLPYEGKGMLPTTYAVLK